jgi:hypothetical protein
MNKINPYVEIKTSVLFGHIYQPILHQTYKFSSQPITIQTPKMLNWVAAFLDTVSDKTTVSAPVEQNIFNLNVGGVLHTTTRSTLLSHTDTFFTALLSGKVPTYTDGNGNIFIDRDGELFKYVLNYLRCGTIYLPHSHHYLHQYFEIKAEAEFFGLTDMAKLLQKDIDLLEQASRQVAKQQNAQGKEIKAEAEFFGLTDMAKLLQKDVNLLEQALRQVGKQQNAQGKEIKAKAEFFGLTDSDIAKSLHSLHSREDINLLEQASRHVGKQQNAQGKENHIEYSGAGTQRMRTDTIIGTVNDTNFQTPTRPASHIISGELDRLCSPKRLSRISRMENLSIEEFPDLDTDLSDF